MIKKEEILPIIQIGETPDGQITHQIINNADMTLAKLVGILNVIIGGMMSKVPEIHKTEVETQLYECLNQTRGFKVNVTPPEE